MNLGVLVAAAARLLDAAALDGHDDHDHGGEDAGHGGVETGILFSCIVPDYDGRHADGDEVLLLEPLLHHVLGRLGRHRHHHVQGEVSHRLARPGHYYLFILSDVSTDILDKYSMCRL